MSRRRSARGESLLLVEVKRAFGAATGNGDWSLGQTSSTAAITILEDYKPRRSSVEETFRVWPFFAESVRIEAIVSYSDTKLSTVTLHVTALS